MSGRSAQVTSWSACAVRGASCARWAPEASPRSACRVVRLTSRGRLSRLASSVMFSMRPQSHLASWPTALVLAATLLAIASPRPAHATKYAGEFLKMPAGARAMGMGGAFVAVRGGASAVMSNPAGTVLLPYHELLPMHAEAFGSLVNYDFGGLVWPLDGGKGKHRALGLGFVRLGVNDIAITPRPEELQPGDWVDDGPDGQPFTGDPGENDGKWEPGERLTQQFYDKIQNKSSSDMA